MKQFISQTTENIKETLQNDADLIVQQQLGQPVPPVGRLHSIMQEDELRAATQVAWRKMQQRMAVCVAHSLFFHCFRNEMLSKRTFTMCVMPLSLQGSAFQGGL